MIPAKEGKCEEKITFLTAGKVNLYKGWLFFLMIFLFGALGFSEYLAIRSGYLISTSLFVGPPILYQLYQIYRHVKPVEFDRKFFCVYESGYQILVRLDNIKTVEIKNLGGIYKVTFFDEIQSGHSILFKPSLIYPLDFKRQDEKVNMLRSWAREARSSWNDLPKNALTS